MRLIIQRVSTATCQVDDRITGTIQKGFMVLIGISDSDTKEIADKMIKKLDFVFLKILKERQIYHCRMLQEACY